MDHSNMFKHLLIQLLLMFTATGGSDIDGDRTRDVDGKESKVLKLFKIFRDPSYECPPSAEGSEDEPGPGPEVFVNAECDEGDARWDYSYKVKRAIAVCISLVSIKLRRPYRA